MAATKSWQLADRVSHLTVSGVADESGHWRSRQLRFGSRMGGAAVRRGGCGRRSRRASKIGWRDGGTVLGRGRALRADARGGGGDRFDYRSGIITQPADGRSLVAVTSQSRDRPGHCRRRTNAESHADTTFGTARGPGPGRSNQQANSIGLDGLGRIVVAGTTPSPTGGRSSRSGSPASPPRRRRRVVQRRRPRRPILRPGSSAQAFAVAVRPATTKSWPAGPRSNRFQEVRVSRSPVQTRIGTPDATFDGDGLATTNAVAATTTRSPTSAGADGKFVVERDQPAGRRRLRAPPRRRPVPQRQRVAGHRLRRSGLVSTKFGYNSAEAAGIRCSRTAGRRRRVRHQRKRLE